MTVVRRPIVLILGAAGAVLAIVKRRRAAGDAHVWRDATSDNSR